MEHARQAVGDSAAARQRAGTARPTERRAHSFREPHRMRYRWGRWSLAVAAIAVAAGRGGRLGACSSSGQLRATASDGAHRRHAPPSAPAPTVGRRCAGRCARLRRPGQAAVAWSRRASAGIDRPARPMTALIASSAADGGAARVARHPRTARRGGTAAARSRRGRQAPHGRRRRSSPKRATAPRRRSNGRLPTRQRRRSAPLPSAEVAALRDRQVGWPLAAALAALASRGPAVGATAAGRRVQHVELRAARRALAQPAAAGARPSATGARAPRPIGRAPAGAPHRAGPAGAGGGVQRTVGAVSDSPGDCPRSSSRAAGTAGATGRDAVARRRRPRQTLRTAATAGYDARLVARIGPIDVGDDNPTARAFATGTPSHGARDGRAAAAAVPVSSAPAAPCGVLSADWASARADRHRGGVSARCTSSRRSLPPWSAATRPTRNRSAPTELQQRRQRQRC